MHTKKTAAGIQNSLKRINTSRNPRKISVLKILLLFKDKNLQLKTLPPLFPALSAVTADILLNRLSVIRQEK